MQASITIKNTVSGYEIKPDTMETTIYFNARDLVKVDLKNVDNKKILTLNEGEGDCRESFLEKIMEIMDEDFLEDILAQPKISSTMLERVFCVLDIKEKMEKVKNYQVIYGNFLPNTPAPDENRVIIFWIKDNDILKPFIGKYNDNYFITKNNYGYTYRQILYWMYLPEVE